MSLKVPYFRCLMLHHLKLVPSLERDEEVELVMEHFRFLKFQMDFGWGLNMGTGFPQFPMAFCSLTIHTMVFLIRLFRLLRDHIEWQNRFMNGPCCRLVRRDVPGHAAWERTGCLEARTSDKTCRVGSSVF